MPDKDNFFELGKIIRAKGVKGELEILLDSDHPDHYKNLESVLLNIQQQLIPFFIRQIRIHGRQATVSLEGIDTLDQALALVDSAVFLPLEKLPLLSGKRFYFHDLIGVRVSDRIYGEIGTINRIYDIARQPVAEIKAGSKEILFPLQAVFIENFDQSARCLYVNLPEGLIDLYLEDPGKGQDNRS